MLNHAVMRVIQVSPSFVMLSLACVFVRDGLSSVEMWIDPSEIRCCGLSKVGMVETVGFRQVMWLVMLGSAKDRILGLDPPGQHVPPRVWYGTACLLIRYAIGCVMLGWVEMAPVFVTCLCDPSLWYSLWTAWTTWCKRGHFVWETSALQAGPLCVRIRSKAWHTLIVGLYNGM
jgi:hypothetical protein